MWITGVETNYRLAASSTEPMVMIADAPVGAPVEVIAQAVNGDRQGVASEPVSYSRRARRPRHREIKPEGKIAAHGKASNGAHALATNGKTHEMDHETMAPSRR